MESSALFYCDVRLVLFCSDSASSSLNLAGASTPTAPFQRLGRASLSRLLESSFLSKIYSQTIYAPLFLCQCCPETVRFLLHISASLQSIFLKSNRSPFSLTFAGHTRERLLVVWPALRRDAETD